MKLPITKGSTSVLVEVFIRDSSSTTGAGLTGLVFNTASLTAYYYRSGAATATAITLATMTVGTWATGGFKEIDATNMPGWYQVGLPDAALATGTNKVEFHLKGAANMAPLPFEIQLKNFDDYDGVRGGLTAIPNAAAGATGGLDAVVLQGGTAQAGAATTITLAAGASATDNLYAGQVLAITGGTGAGQGRLISSYVGSTKVATVEQAWITTPDSTSVYQVNSQRVPYTLATARGYAAAASGNTITLQTALGANNVINGSAIAIVAGTGIGQNRTILLYTDSTKIATVDKPWGTTPDTTSVYVVSGPPIPILAVVTAGTAAAGASTSITLAATASATNNFYNECYAQLVGGTGVGQVRTITAYNGSTQVATVDRAWAVNPDSTSIYSIVLANLAATDGSGAISTVAAVTGAVGSVTGNVGGNVVGSVASVTGAVGSVTGNVGGNVTGSVASVVGNVGGNVVGSVGSVTAGVTVTTNNDKTGYSLTSLESLNLHSGTAQTGSSSTTIKLAAGAESANDNLYRGCVVKIYGGTGTSQARVVTAYVASTRVATLDRAWIVTPDNTSTYAVLALDLPASDTSLQVAANAVNGNVTGSVASVVGAVGSVTGNVGGNVVGSVASVTGNVTGSVGSVASGGITTASFGTGAIDANAFAQGAADKIWTSTTRTLSAFSTALALSVWDVLESAIGTASSIGVKVKTALPAIAAGASGGLPTVDSNNAVKVQSGTGANQISLSSGLVSLATPDSDIANSGTATAGSSTTITLPVGASGTDQLYRGALLKLTGGTGVGQARSVTDYTSRVVTVDRAWTTNPDNTTTYAVVFADIPKVDASGQVTAASVQGNVTGSVGSVTGAVGSVTGNVGGNVVGTVASVVGNVGGNVVGSVASVTGAVGSVTGNVGGNVTGSVGSVVAGVTVTTNNDKTGYSLTTLESSVLASGTASAGSSTTLTLAGASTTTSLYNGLILKIYGGTGAGQARVITAYNSSRVATVDTAWITTPDNTSQFAVIAIEAAKLDSSQQVTAASVQGNVTGSVASVTGAAGSVTGAVGSVTGNVGGNVTGSIGSLASGAQSDVKTQVVAALTTDTYAEVSGVPAATSSLKDKINWVFALARNKITQTATTQTLRNDSDTTSIATNTDSDDSTTYTRGKWS